MASSIFFIRIYIHTFLEHQSIYLSIELSICLCVTCITLCLVISWHRQFTK